MGCPESVSGPSCILKKHALVPCIEADHQEFPPWPADTISTLEFHPGAQRAKSQLVRASFAPEAIKNTYVTRPKQQQRPASEKRPPPLWLPPAAFRSSRFSRSLSRRLPLLSGFSRSEPRPRPGLSIRSLSSHQVVACGFVPSSVQVLPGRSCGSDPCSTSRS